MKHTLNTVLSSLRRNQNVKVGTSTVSVDKPVGIGTWGRLDYLRKVHNYKVVNNAKGYTLIELLVVVAILMIIMAVAIPAYIGQRDKARETAHQSNIKILQDAATFFVLDNPSVSTIWAPFEGQEADPTIEITDTNLHDSWQRYISDKWPVNPLKTGAYVVEITESGKITVSPQGGAE